MKRKVKYKWLKFLVKHKILVRKAIHRKCDVCGDVLSEYFIKDIGKLKSKYVMYHPGFMGCYYESNHRRHVYKLMLNV